MTLPSRPSNPASAVSPTPPAPSGVEVRSVPLTLISKPPAPASRVAATAAGARHPLDFLPPPEFSPAPPEIDAGLAPPSSLYLHVPFCVHKCSYCDFYSLVDTQDRQAAFAARIEAELRALARHADPLRTIFVGGGTPSLLALPYWEQLLNSLHTHFDLRATRSSSAQPFEFTVECNPESVTPELLRLLKHGGVNRISLGAQSFNPRHLRTLERIHNPANVARALDLAHAAGITRTSIDLIFAIPGQTLAEWHADLDTALALGTEHLSCYSLTFESGTGMTARLLRGDFSRTDDDLEARMYIDTLARLRAAGFERYEISNYARTGGSEAAFAAVQSRHNLAYWRQEPWLAAGPSASGFAYGWRWKNVPRLDDYLRAPVAESGLPAVQDVEPPDVRRLLSELVMTGLRLAEGVDAPRVQRLASTLAERNPADASLAARLAQLMAVLARDGLAYTDPDRWRLTDEGLIRADAIAVRFLEIID